MRSRPTGLSFQLTCLACALAAPLAPARADPVAEFYKGRTVAIVVGHQVGTGYDTYARVLARHMPRHLPGQPTMIVQNMLGVSGITAANWLYAIAPKDGTAIGTFAQTVVLDPLMGGTAGKFDATGFNWIGNLESSVATCLATRASGIASFEDLTRRETLFGVTTVNGSLAQFTLAIRNLLGAKARLVSGYQGSASIGVAMQRGEVEAQCGANTTFIATTWATEVGSGLFKVILQLNGARRPELKGVAHAYDLARSEEDRRILEFVLEPRSLGRIFAAPPGVPAERVAALRAAMMATAADPQFLADAERTRLEIAAMPGEELAAQIARYYATPRQLLDKAMQAVKE